MNKEAATFVWTITTLLIGACSIATEEVPFKDVSAKGEALVGTCVGDPASRSDCGFPGITARQCWDRGCCFDDSVPDVPWCYAPMRPDEGTGPPIEP